MKFRKRFERREQPPQYEQHPDEYVCDYPRCQFKASSRQKMEGHIDKDHPEEGRKK